MTLFIKSAFFHIVPLPMTIKKHKNGKISNDDHMGLKRDFICGDLIIINLTRSIHPGCSLCALLVNFSIFQIVVSWMTPKNCKKPKISNDDSKHPKRDFRCDNWIIVKMI